MRVYELTFILDSSLDNNAVETEINKLSGQIKASDGEVLEVQRLGIRKLTYEINKHRQGNYITFYYRANSNVPKQLEINMKLNESIIRCLTIIVKPSEYKPPVKEEVKEKAPVKEEVIEKAPVKEEVIEKAPEDDKNNNAALDTDAEDYQSDKL